MQNSPPLSSITLVQKSVASSPMKSIQMSPRSSPRKLDQNAAAPSLRKSIQMSPRPSPRKSKVSADVAAPRSLSEINEQSLDKTKLSESEDSIVAASQNAAKRKRLISNFPLSKANLDMSALIKQAMESNKGTTIKETIDQSMNRDDSMTSFSDTSSVPETPEDRGSPHDMFDALLDHDRQLIIEGNNVLPPPGFGNVSIHNPMVNVLDIIPDILSVDRQQKNLSKDKDAMSTNSSTPERGVNKSINMPPAHVSQETNSNNSTSQILDADSRNINYISKRQSVNANNSVELFLHGNVSPNTSSARQRQSVNANNSIELSSHDMVRPNASSARRKGINRSPFKSPLNITANAKTSNFYPDLPLNQMLFNHENTPGAGISPRNLTAVLDGESEENYISVKTAAVVADHFKDLVDDWESDEAEEDDAVTDVDDGTDDADNNDVMYAVSNDGVERSVTETLGDSRNNCSLKIGSLTPVVPSTSTTVRKSPGKSKAGDFIPKKQMSLKDFLVKLHRKEIEAPDKSKLLECQKEVRDIINEQPSQKKNQRKRRNDGVGSAAKPTANWKTLPLQHHRTAFDRFSKRKQSRAVISEVSKVTETFFSYLINDLIKVSTCRNKKASHIINESDVIFLLKHQGLIDSNQGKQSLNALVEEYFPMDEWPHIAANKPPLKGCFGNSYYFGLLCYFFFTYATLCIVAIDRWGQ